MKSKVWAFLYYALSAAFGILSIVSIGKEWGNSELLLILCLVSSIRAHQYDEKGESNE